MFPSVYVMDLGVIFPAIFLNNVPGTCLQGIGCGEDSGYNYYNFNQGKKKKWRENNGEGCMFSGCGEKICNPPMQSVGSSEKYSMVLFVVAFVLFVLL